MRRILLINSYHYRRGGADVVYLEQGRLLRQMGWHVVDFAMRHPRNEQSDYSADFSEEIEYGHPYSAMTKLRHAGKVIHSMEAAKKVRTLIERERPDVVHAHNLYHHLSPSVLHASKQCGVPVLLTTHDLKLLCPAISMLSHGKTCEECNTSGRFSVVRKRCLKGSFPLSTLVFAESTLHAFAGIYRKLPADLSIHAVGVPQPPADASARLQRWALRRRLRPRTPAHALSESPASAHRLGALAAMRRASRGAALLPGCPGRRSTAIRNRRLGANP